MEVKDILRQRREELGLSMRQLADILGVSESTVSRWESGYIAHMKRSMIVRLASALQISPLVIVGVENWQQEKPAEAGKESLSETQLKLIEAIKHMSEERAESLCLLLGL